MKVMFKNLFNGVMRRLMQLKRPSPAQNKKRLELSGTVITDLTIREATLADLSKLVSLHVQAWNETYWSSSYKPTHATRLHQWQEQFKKPSGWFCMVVEDKDRQLVGFAKGRHYAHTDLPAYSGELNKLYLLLPYQRLGLGRKLVTAVAKRFIAEGITTMVLFGDPKNPSCAFHEKMGGKKLYAANGEFHGGYGWTDLHLVTA